MKKRAIGILTVLCGMMTCAQVPVSAQATNSPSATPTKTASAPSGITTTTPAPASEEMAPIYVTGSLIPTTAGEVGPTPVDYVSDDAIVKTDSNNLYDALKKVSPDFQGASNFGQELNNNGASAGESTLALRNLNTLILLDGNRLSPSPFSQISTPAVNLNLIPTSFIDHVEVLKDGASTLYGSDAVGGVVNIITKKNFTGAEIRTQYSLGTDQGGYYAYKTSAMAGVSTDTTSVVAGIEYTDNNEIKSTDRPVASYSQRQLAGLNSTSLPSYFSSNYPQVFGVGTAGPYIFAANPLAKGAPGYNPALGATPGIIPGGLSADPATQDAQLAAAGYIPAGTIPSAVDGTYRLNTTQYGTYSYTPQEREQAYGNISEDLYHDTLQVFGTFIYNHGRAQGSLAPQPSGAGIYVPADNPYNPFGVAIGSDPEGDVSDSGISAKYRFLDAGNRVFNQTDDYYHFVGGLKGDFGIGNSGEKDYHYSISFGYDNEESKYVTSNLINDAAFQEAVAGTLPGFEGIFYNPFGIPQSNNGALTRAITANSINTSTSTLMENKIDLSATPFSLPGGPVGFGVGGEYRIESLDGSIDGISQNGGFLNDAGSAGGNFALKQRDTKAMYLEGNIPITGPSMHIPGLYSLSVDASGRYEGIEAGAVSRIARVALRYQPFDDELTLRANFSQSFQAPSLYQLYGPASSTAAAVNLPGGGGEGAGIYQETINLESGPTPNSTAQNYGFGAVYSPKWAKGLTVSADYYNVIFSATTHGSFQSIVDSINQLGPASPYAKDFHSVTPLTGPDQAYDANFISLDTFPSTTASFQKTQGIDMNLNYVLPWQQYGVFTIGASATYLIDYYSQDSPNGQFTNYAGTFSDPNYVGGGAQGLLPKYQVNPYFEYTWGGFDYNLSCQFIPRINDLGDINGENSINSGTAKGNPYKVDSYSEFDTSASYEFGKPTENEVGAGSLTSSGHWYDTTKFTVGVNNFMDASPPLVPSSVEDNTAKGTYDIIGRFVFFQLSKKF
jgi:iron complex outermembrane receptor protein